MENLMGAICEVHSEVAKFPGVHNYIHGLTTIGDELEGFSAPRTNCKWCEETLRCRDVIKFRGHFPL